MVSRETNPELPLHPSPPRPDVASVVPVRRPVDVAALSAAWWGAIEPLWVGGLAIFCLLASWAVFSSPWLDLQGKTYDWAQYAVAGVVFPGLLFGVPLLWAWRGLPTAAARPTRRLLALGCLVAFAALVVVTMVKHGPASELVPVVLAVAQTVLMVRPWRESIDLRQTAIVFAVALAAWTVAVSLGLGVLIAPPVSLAGFALAFLLVCAAVWYPEASDRVAPIRLWSPANVAALAVIGVMSLRTEGLFEVLGERGALHHWSAWVGTAELVREGGWLLWDIPSMYGFLSILTLAAVPTETPWKGFYLLQALAFFIVGGGLFLLLRAVRPGVLNWVFALATAISVPMFFAVLNDFGQVTSTFVFPNAGAYRYVMCFVVVMFLVWEYLTDEQSARHALILIAGCGAWLVGVLWSPESAFFCSGAWLPAYAVNVLRSTASGSNRWVRAALWLALPVALLAASVGVLAVVYTAGLGHLPDWASYLDYVLGLGVNALAVVNEPLGPSLGLLLGFCALAVGAFYAGTRRGLPTRSFGLWVGLLGAFWAVNSYGYQRGGGTLHPVAFAVLAVLLMLAMGQANSRGWSSIARAGIVPLFVLALAAPLAAVVANPFAVSQAAASLVSTARSGFQVESYLPDADPELQALLAEAGVDADDPIYYAADWLGNPLLPWRQEGAADSDRVIVNRHWLSGHPAFTLRWILEGRAPIYTIRFIARAPQSGWMIQSKSGEGSSADFNAYASGLDPWLFDVLEQTHVPTRIYESANWQAVWFEYVGDDAVVARPDYHVGRLGPLPPDILVDGTPLSEASDPEIWAVFGEGWGLFDEERGRGMGGGRAQVWIYSPVAREIRMSVTPSRTSRQTRLKLEGDGVVAEERAPRLKPGRTAEVPVSLRVGWNTITLNEQRRGALQRASDDGSDSTTTSALPTEKPVRHISIERIELLTQSTRE